MDAQRLKYLPVLALLLISGCASLKAIPLFNNDASLHNRIQSAKEVETFVMNGLSDARDQGLVTQAQIDTSIMPAIKVADGLIDQAALLEAAGQNDQAASKIDTAKQLLLVLKNDLLNLKKKG